jgi:hypothetical protein
MTYLVDTDWVASYLNGRTDAIELINVLATRWPGHKPDPLRRDLRRYLSRALP